MRKIGLILFTMLGVFFATFVVGTFFDFQISEAIFHNKDNFGLVVSVLGEIPGYAMLAFIGGGWIALAIHRDYKTYIKVILYVAAAVAVGCATYFAGQEFFGPNGFEGITYRFVGWFIALPVMAGVTYLGYRMCRNSEQEYLWLFLVIMAVALFLAFVPGVTLIKSIFHRPRFRSISTTGLEYYPWYLRCDNYETLMENFSLAKEEFKSFPSGHAAVSLAFPATVLFLPFIKKDYSKYVLPCFICGLAWSLLVMFARLLVGAHFLSDVSMGAIITTTMCLVALVVIKGTKKLNI